MEGRCSRVTTLGNKYSHIVLRGGNGSPNYTSEKVQKALNFLETAGIPRNVIIDCSHGNSCKDYKKQEEISHNVLEQVLNGNQDIVGIMLESNLQEGKQEFPETEEKRKNLTEGCSMTDECISWETTERIIKLWRDELRQMRS